jgi:hypothetical protein
MADSQQILVQMAENIGRIAGTVEAIKDKQDEHAEQLQSAVSSHGARIESLENSRRKVIFGVTGFSLAGGLAGTKIGAILSFLTGQGNAP